MAPVSSHRRRTRVNLLFLVLCTHLVLFTPNVAAIPAADYREKLKNAITILESIEDVEGFDFEAEHAHSLTTIRNSLPEHQTVESNGEVYNIDNSWVHKGLDELKDPTNRFEKLSLLLERLRALEQRVAELQNPAHPGETKDQAKQKLDNILSRPEYNAGARGPNALMRLIRDFARWLEKFLPKPRAMNPSRIDWIIAIVKFVVLGLAALVIGYVLIRVIIWLLGRSTTIKERKPYEPRIVLGERLEPDATATDLLSDAEALARQGDLRAAIRKAYIALLVELGDRKLISLARHKTNRDYLNSLRGVPQLHSRMRGLTDSFERHWYGFANATPNDWQDFRAGYLAALESGTN
jgi:uncharacterized protein DUF4129